MTIVVDAHVRVGTGREARLAPGDLLAAMDELGIDRALVSPDEREIAWANRQGNDRVCALARRHPDRLAAYAVASPWGGAAALDELRRAQRAGAVALAVDPALQGFDLLDGLVDPLLELARDFGWLVYVRSGTPPCGLPLQIAELARAHPAVPFLMGRGGAADYVADVRPALLRAPNLLVDTAHVTWDTLLAALADDPAIGIGRVVFASDLPYGQAAGTLEHLAGWPLAADERARVLGGNLTSITRRRTA